MPELPQVAGPLLLRSLGRRSRPAWACRILVSVPQTPHQVRVRGRRRIWRTKTRIRGSTPPAPAFVTLTQQGALRGCIGSLTAYRPLREDVADNAVNAALRDPRSPPLSARELAETRIEVSVLSEPEPYPFTHRADAVSGSAPGVDG